MRMANWQLRIVLPTLVRVARASEAPNPQLDLIIAELTAVAHLRGLESILTGIGQEYALSVAGRGNGEGPTPADPSPAVDPSPKA